MYMYMYMYMYVGIYVYLCIYIYVYLYTHTHTHTHTHKLIICRGNWMLTTLSLKRNRIAREGGNELGLGLQENNVLRELYVNSNVLTDDGLVELSRAIRYSLYLLYSYKGTRTDCGAVPQSKTKKLLFGYYVGPRGKSVLSLLALLVQ